MYQDKDGNITVSSGSHTINKSLFTFPLIPSVETKMEPVGAKVAKEEEVKKPKDVAAVTVEVGEDVYKRTPGDEKSWSIIVLREDDGMRCEIGKFFAVFASTPKDIILFNQPLKDMKNIFAVGKSIELHATGDKVRIDMSHHYTEEQVAQMVDGLINDVKKRGYHPEFHDDTGLGDNIKLTKSFVIVNGHGFWRSDLDSFDVAGSQILFFRKGKTEPFRVECVSDIAALNLCNNFAFLWEESLCDGYDSGFPRWEKLCKQIA
jgi:hypothetical protein